MRCALCAAFLRACCRAREWTDLVAHEEAWADHIGYDHSAGWFIAWRAREMAAAPADVHAGAGDWSAE
jgi:hypothetical protein